MIILKSFTICLYYYVFWETEDIIVAVANVH